MEDLLTASLLLICAASTASARAGGFSHAQEPLDERGARDAKALRVPSRFTSTLYCSPWASARQTAESLGPAKEEPAIADIDPGLWGGLSFDRIEAADPGAFPTWLANPIAGAPGGESMAAAQARIGPWLDDIAALDGQVCAVTHPMMIRVALAHAIVIPAEATLAIDITPLSCALLSFNRIWRLQALGKPPS